MNPNDELGSLGYNSSAPDLSDLAPMDEVKPQDEADLPTLRKIFSLLQKWEDHYKSNDALAFGQELTIENQLIINTKLRFHLHELQSVISSTVLKVEEKQNERRQQ